MSLANSFAANSLHSRQFDCSRNQSPPSQPGGFFLHRCTFIALIPRMGTKTTFICDCCFREADDNLGWAHVSVTGASEGKQLMPDYNRDLCMICWSPLQTLLDEVHEKAREKRAAGDTAPS